MAFKLVFSHFNITRQSFIYSLFWWAFETSHLHHDKVHYSRVFLLQVFPRSCNLSKSAVAACPGPLQARQRPKRARAPSPSCRAEGGAAANMAAADVCVNDRGSGREWQGLRPLVPSRALIYAKCMYWCYIRKISGIFLIQCQCESRAASREIRGPSTRALPSTISELMLCFGDPSKTSPGHRPRNDPSVWMRSKSSPGAGKGLWGVLFTWGVSPWPHPGDVSSAFPPWRPGGKAWRSGDALRRCGPAQGPQSKTSQKLHQNSQIREKIMGCQLPFLWLVTCWMIFYDFHSAAVSWVAVGLAGDFWAEGMGAEGEASRRSEREAGIWRNSWLPESSAWVTPREDLNLVSGYRSSVRVSRGRRGLEAVCFLAYELRGTQWLCREVFCPLEKLFRPEMSGKKYLSQVTRKPGSLDPWLGALLGGQRGRVGSPQL